MSLTPSSKKGRENNQRERLELRLACGTAPGCWAQGLAPAPAVVSVERIEFPRKSSVSENRSRMEKTLARNNPGCLLQGSTGWPANGLCFPSSKLTQASVMPPVLGSNQRQRSIRRRLERSLALRWPPTPAGGTQGNGNPQGRAHTFSPGVEGSPSPAGSRLP